MRYIRIHVTLGSHFWCLQERKMNQKKQNRLKKAAKHKANSYTGTISQLCTCASGAVVDITSPTGFCYVLAAPNFCSAPVAVTARPFPRYMVPVLHSAILRYVPHPSGGINHRTEKRGTKHGKVTGGRACLSKFCRIRWNYFPPSKCEQLLTMILYLRSKRCL